MVTITTHEAKTQILSNQCGEFKKSYQSLSQRVDALDMKVPVSVNEKSTSPEEVENGQENAKKKESGRNKDGDGISLHKAFLPRVVESKVEVENSNNSLASVDSILVVGRGNH